MRNMATNHNVLKIKAIMIPGARPNLAIMKGTTKGKITAPNIGVKATIGRNIFKSDYLSKPLT